MKRSYVGTGMGFWLTLATPGTDRAGAPIRRRILPHASRVRLTVSASRTVFRTCRRRRQAADRASESAGLIKVTPKAFGAGWRFPIAQRFGARD